MRTFLIGRGSFRLTFTGPISFSSSIISSAARPASVPAELMNFPPEEFERFRSVQYVAKEYYECITILEEIILRSDDPDYFDSLDSDIGIFCMYLDSFKETFEAQKSSEKNDKYLGYILDMDTELKAAMRRYFSMDEGELNELLDMSRAQKAVKIQEVLK